jgi:hypothetical protein
MAPSSAQPVADLVAGLLSNPEALVQRMLASMRAQIPVYADLDLTELAPVAVTSIERILLALHETRGLTDDEVDGFRRHGDLRARQRVSAEQMFNGWQIAVRVALETMSATGRKAGVSDAALLDLAHDLLAITDVASRALSQGHREAEAELARQEQHGHADLVRGILFGTLTTTAIRTQCEAYGLDMERDYHALRARPTSSVPIIELERTLGLTPGAARPRGLTAVIDGDLAGFVDQPPRIEVETAVGIGSPAHLDRLDASFRQASRAMTTAAAFGLEGVHDLTSLGLLPAVLADEEIGDHLINRYITPLGNDDAATVLAETVRHYLTNGMRADTTAQHLFVHHNTVRYRLRRFEELTGTDLRDPNCALEAWWALQRTRLGEIDTS